MAENYVVSALKYRPQHFNTVVGQSHITTTLKNAIKTGHLAHSFLFTGPRGVGKTTCARILAKTINCTNRTDDAEACDECTSCITFRENTSFNIHELDAASNNSVDDIRELIEQVRFAPQGGAKYKVYIIDEVHMLSSAAFNAFLKTLEEPPSYAIFILATTEKHKILPTILSRCQIFDFNRITSKDTVEHLQEICTKENIQAEAEALHLIAQKSEGCMRDALSIMDKIASFSNQLITYTSTVEHLNILDYDYYFKLVESLMVEDISNVLLTYDEINKRGFEGDMFLNGFIEHMRNTMISKDPRIVKLLDLPDNVKAKYYTHGNQLTQSYIVNALSILNQAEMGYKAARNKRLHVELALIKLNFLHQAISVVQDDEHNTVKKKQLSGNAQVLKYARARVQPLEAKVSIDNILSPSEEVQTVNETEPSQPSSKQIETPQITPATSSESQNYGLSAANYKDIKNLMRSKLKSQESNQPKIEISDENLQQYWEKHVEDITKGKPFFNSSLKKLKPTFEGYNITFLCDHVSADFLKERRMDLLEYFKGAYNNTEINVLFETKEEEYDPSTRVLSSKEIFEKMAIKNPILKQLRDELGMEFD